MKNFKKQLLFLSILLQTAAFAQVVHNSSFNQINQDGSMAYWGNVYLFQFNFDSSGVQQGDSIVFDGPLYAPSTDSYNGAYAIELHNAWNYTSNTGIIGAVASDDDTVFSSWGLLNLVPTNGTVFNPFIPFNFGFHYKFYPVNGDSASASLVLYDSIGVPIAQSEIIISDSATNYTQVYAPLVYTGSGVAVFYSLQFHNFYTAIPGYKQPSFGTHLLIDNIGFNYVTTDVHSAREADAEIELFPNPAENEITVSGQANESMEIRVLTLLGEEILPKQNQSTVNISNLPSGIYFVEAKSSASRRMLRFVKS